MEAGILRELGRIAYDIPHDQITIQWDVAVEFGILEASFATCLQNKKEEILDRLVRLGDVVQKDVEFGYRLCYGDMRLRHFVELRDTGLLVEISNGIINGVRRPLQWIHMPVPIDRNDDAYFAPLKELVVPDGTEIFLGLVHMPDGMEGAKRRIVAATRYLPRFGVASECGLSQHDAAWTAEMLILQRRIAEA